MSCVTQQVYFTGPLRKDEPFTGTYAHTERWMDEQCQMYLLLPDFTCDGIKDAIEPFLSDPASYIAIGGASFAKPTLADITYDGAFTQSSYSRFEVIVDGVSRGLIGRAMDYDGNMETTDTISGVWPLALDSFSEIRFEVQVRNGQQGGESYAAPDITFTRQFSLLQSFDFDAFFCCNSVAVGRNCCGAPPAGRRMGFVIPKPPGEPDVGDEQLSTPVLKSPMYVSNHTFAFTNSFWR